MIKIYGHPECPDCTYLDPQIEGKTEYVKYDISKKDILKEFLLIRDTAEGCASLHGSGSIGIPCFVLEDGTVTLKPEDAGLQSRPEEEVQEFSCGNGSC